MSAAYAPRSREGGREGGREEGWMERGREGGRERGGGELSPPGVGNYLPVNLQRGDTKEGTTVAPTMDKCEPIKQIVFCFLTLEKTKQVFPREAEPRISLMCLTQLHAYSR